MSAKLDIVYNLIQRLRDHGINVVCCGGAARDTYLGREPKDYDFVIMNNAEGFDYLTELADVLGGSVQELGDLDYVENAEDRGLQRVFEGLADGFMTVQFLLYTPKKTKSFAGDPYNIVEDFDCTLNYAWFEEYNGKLLVRVHPEFPSIQYGIQPVHRDSTDERRVYIKSKFPEFY